jgi:Kef-type K+ transport system membrane component KefB
MLLLAEIAIVLIVAKLAGELASRWDQPPVLGQLIAGLLLGAGLSLIDNPAFRASGSDLDALASLGVVVLMFLAGLETDWDQLRATGRAAFVSASFGVAVPLAGGYGLGVLFGLPPLEALFVGVILTATSVSITAQTLMEMGSLQTVEGATVLGAAVIDDVIGLIVFSLVVALTASSGGSTGEAPNLVLLGVYLLVFFVASATVIPWLIEHGLRYAERMRGAEAMLALALAIGLLYGVAAERAGLAAITGAYLAGLLINRHNTYPDITDRMKVLAYGFFVPIFLVKTGMNAQLDALGPALGFVVLTTAMAVLAKIVGCGLGARLCGLTNSQSLIVGVGMISRGEVALVVATLALQSGAISQAVFGATVVIVVATTVVTPPLLRVALRRAPAAESLRGIASDPV